MYLIIGCLLGVQNVCPKDNDEVFNLSRNSEPHRYDDAIISVTLRKKAHSYPWFIFPFISIDHRECRKRSYIKAELAAFALAKRKYYQIFFLTTSYHFVPLLSLVSWWKHDGKWHLFVTAVWLPLLTRNEDSGKTFKGFFSWFSSFLLFWVLFLE